MPILLKPEISVSCDCSPPRNLSPDLAAAVPKAFRIWWCKGPYTLRYIAQYIIQSRNEMIGFGSYILRTPPLGQRPPLLALMILIDCCHDQSEQENASRQLFLYGGGDNFNEAIFGKTAMKVAKFAISLNLVCRIISINGQSWQRPKVIFKCWYRQVGSLAPPPPTPKSQFMKSLKCEGNRELHPHIRHDFGNPAGGSGLKFHICTWSYRTSIKR